MALSCQECQNFQLLLNGERRSDVRPRVSAGGQARAVNAARRTKPLQDELRQRNAQLAALACTDPLTGLHNRRHAVEQLELLSSRSRRHGAALSIVLIDVDRFKAINDAFGHAGGDGVLLEVATRMRDRMRHEDLVAPSSSSTPPMSRSTPPRPPVPTRHAAGKR